MLVKWSPGGVCLTRSLPLSGNRRATPRWPLARSVRPRSRRVPGTTGYGGSKTRAEQAWHPCPHYTIVTLQSALWRLKSPTTRLYGQTFVKANIKQNIKTRVTGPSWGNPPAAGGLPSQRACNEERISMWCNHNAFDGSVHNRGISIADLVGVLQFCTKPALTITKKDVHRLRDTTTKITSNHEHLNASEAEISRWNCTPGLKPRGFNLLLSSAFNQFLPQDFTFSVSHRRVSGELQLSFSTLPKRLHINFLSLQWRHNGDGV